MRPACTATLAQSLGANMVVTSQDERTEWEGNVVWETDALNSIRVILNTAPPIYVTEIDRIDICNIA